jgi:hypothetical protein
LTPNDPYMGHNASLNSKSCILYIYWTNIGTEYFKRALYSPFSSLQNAVCLIMLTCLVPVLFIFYIQGVLKLENNSDAKSLSNYITMHGQQNVKSCTFPYLLETDTRIVYAVTVNNIVNKINPFNYLHSGYTIRWTSPPFTPSFVRLSVSP